LYRRTISRSSPTKRSDIAALDADHHADRAHDLDETWHLW
jgi:hypothetical protein